MSHRHADTVTGFHQSCVEICDGSWKQWSLNKSVYNLWNVCESAFWSSWEFFCLRWLLPRFLRTIFVHEINGNLCSIFCIMLLIAHRSAVIYKNSVTKLSCLAEDNDQVWIQAKACGWLICVLLTQHGVYFIIFIYFIYLFILLYCGAYHLSEQT